MPKTAPPGSFGHKLAAALSDRRMGARTLARVLVSAYGGSLEGHRRQVIHWLQGSTPQEWNRERVEGVLGMERDSLKGEDAEEDESWHALIEALDARLDERIKRAMAGSPS